METNKKLTQRQIARVNRYFAYQSRWKTCQTIGQILYHSNIPTEQAELLLQYFQQTDFVEEFLPSIIQK